VDPFSAGDFLTGPF